MPVTPEAANHGEAKTLTPCEWTTLSPGDRVIVSRAGESTETGAIHEIAPNASAFWAWLDHGKGRILVHKDDLPLVRRVR